MKRFLTIFLSLVCCLLPIGCSNNITYTSFGTNVFSSSIPFTLFIIGENKNDAYEEMIEMFDKLNMQININDYNIESDVLKLNRAEKLTSIEIGEYAYNMIKKGKEIYLESNQALNIASYPLTYLWGVDSLSLAYYNGEYSTRPIPPSFINSGIEQTNKPTMEQIQRIKAYCNLDYLSVYKEDDKYFATKEIDELMIDLGAMAKGYAVDLCKEICEKYEIDSALINLAGNIYTFGRYYDKGWHNSWDIYVNEPTLFSPKSICKIKTDINTTLVTSGDYLRYRLWSNDSTSLENSYQIAHMIDTKRGTPYGIYEQDGSFYNIDDRIISCTIITDNSMLADAYATVACIKGLRYSYEFLSNKGLKAIIFTANGQYSLINDVQLTDTEVYDGYKNYTLYSGQ